MKKLLLLSRRLRLIKICIARMSRTTNQQKVPKRERKIKNLQGSSLKRPRRSLTTLIATTKLRQPQTEMPWTVLSMKPTLMMTISK